MPPVRVEHRDPGIAVIVLDDPDRRNAMTVEMGDALSATAAQLHDEDDVRVVVITGEPPAFSAGGDLGMLEELAARTREEGFDATETMREFYARFLTLRELPVPVIAAVNGHAVGAGLCVALACDLMIVAEDAKVGLNFAKLGLHPGMGGSWLLPQAVGQAQAARLLYTGRLIPGSEAAAIGMATSARPSAEVMPAALELAAEIAQASPVVVRQIKQTLQQPKPDLDAALAREAACQAVNYGTDDLREGLAAGRERRPADFPGR